MNRTLLRFFVCAACLSVLLAFSSGLFNQNVRAGKANCATLAIEAVALPTGTVNQPYNAALESSGGSGPYQFSKLTGTLPNGVTLNLDGTFSGTPTQSGLFTLTVQTQDANGCSGTQDFSLTINCQTITVTAPATNAGLVNAPFSAQFTQSGGSGTTTFSTVSTLPNGITLALSGTLSGATAQTGSFPLVVTATDSNGCTGTVNYTLTINACPTLFTVNSLLDTPDAVPGNTACADVNGQCTLRAAIMEANALTACAALTINFSVTGEITLASGLPSLDHPNLTFNGPGATVLSIARPIEAASFRLFVLNGGRTASFRGLKFTGANTNNGGAFFNAGTLTLNEVIISDNVVTENGGGIRNEGTLLLSNSTLSGNRATGAFNEGGGLYNVGTATVVNTTFVENEALSGGGVLCTPGSTLRMSNATLTSNRGTNNSSGLGNVNASVFVRNSLIAANVNNATLPDVAGAFTSLGANLIGNVGTATGFNAAGDQTGTGTAPLEPRLAALGSYGGPTPTCALLPGSPAINAGQNCVLTDNCANNNLGFSLANDQRGAGFNRQAGGAVDSGAFESRGFSMVSVSGNNQSAPLNQFFNTQLVVSVNSAFNEPVEGGVVTFIAPVDGASATLFGSPSTLFASHQGNVSMQANGQPGNYQIQATARGAAPVNFTLNNECPALNFTVTSTPVSCPGGQNGSLTINATGGFGALQYSINGGQSFQVSNVFSNLSAGSYQIVVKGSDVCAAATGTATVAQPAALAIAPATAPGAFISAPYSQTFSVTGGTGNKTLRLVGTLPLGFNFSNGVLSGTTTQTGTFTFSLSATDQNGCQQTQPYTLQVTCPAVSLNPAALPNGVLGTTYNQALSAAPAGLNYNFTVLGQLPPGLTLTGSGTLSGTLTAAGNYAFGVKASFGACEATRSYNILIIGTCAAITVNPTTLPSTTVGAAYNQTVTASPAGNYTFAITQGALPAGLTLDASTGAITGTATQGGSFSFRLTATGAGGCSGSRTYFVTVNCGTLTLAPNALPNGTRGVAYSQQLSVNPATSATFSLAGGSLPPGFNLSREGLLSGLTSIANTYNFVVKAVAGSCQGTKAYALVINTGNAALALSGDYDGDGHSDPTLWSAKDGVWRISKSSTGQAINQSWGMAGDVTLLGDYDGDGKSDLAVFRPSDATFYVKRSSDGGYLVKQWGLSTDVPVPGDYDGDGKTDIAVWRGSTGTWYILYTARSSEGQFDAQSWGSALAPYSDVPVAGDYDGDGKSDVAVFRRGNGTWLIKRSSDGQYAIKQWGLGTDVPVAADYDGDGQTDMAVWRGSSWYIWQSASKSARVVEWGSSAAPYHDLAAPGDYDGDGQADVTVWRASAGAWYIECSRDGARMSKASGQVGDRPAGPR